MSEPPIIFVRRRFSPYGGGELILQHTMAELAARGRRVAIVSASWPNASPGVDFIPCPPSSSLRPFRARSFSEAACRAVAGIGPALVQSNDRMTCCDVFRAGEGIHAAYLERRRRHEPMLGRIALSASLFHRELLRLERETFASGRLQAVIAISEMVADDIRAHFDCPPGLVRCIPNGIDIEKFSPRLREHHRDSRRAAMGIAADTPVILFVGSGFARKGLPFALDALRAVGNDAQLWVVGRDPRQDRFEAAARDLGVAHRVRFLGPDSDLSSHYGAADALVLPSIYEPFGTVVLEAMASGLPAVVSIDCGARELVRRFDPELVAEAADPQALAAALDRALLLARRPDTAERVRLAAEHYSLRTMVDRMLAVYDDIAA